MTRFRLKVRVSGDERGPTTFILALDGDNTATAHADADMLIRKFAYQGYMQVNENYYPWHEIRSLTVVAYE